MKTTLNLTTAVVALSLFATASILSTAAEAADREISVNPKNFPTFTVNKDNEAPAEVATKAPDEAPQAVKPKAFTVNEKPEAKEDVAADQAKPRPRVLREKPNARPVDDNVELAGTKPIIDDEQDASPANPLDENAKLIKKQPPEQGAPDDEATTDDGDHADEIAADKNQPDGADVADTTEEPVTEPIAPRKPRTYYYAAKQKSYEQSHEHDDVMVEPVADSYQHSDMPTYYDYSGASCHHDYEGY
jgi:hypothetical protein